MFDLWGDEKTTTRDEGKPKVTAPREKKDLSVTIEGSTIFITTEKNLELDTDYSSLYGASKEVKETHNLYSIPLRAVNAYILRYLLRRYTLSLTPQHSQVLKSYANKIPAPRVDLADTGKHMTITTPPIDSYRQILRALNGYPAKDGTYRVSITRALDLEHLAQVMEGDLPRFTFTDAVKELSNKPIPGFDGTITSLKSIPMGELHVVAANSQSYKTMKKSKKTLEEKLAAFGIETLYDLLNWLPRRYIDKSKPQSISNLIVDEPATIIGAITKVDLLPRNMGVSFTIGTADEREIRVSFWRQLWLQNKFKIGDEVLVTGKFTIWNRTPQLNGTSIEDAKEAAVLPIVPVYKQSESRGITTAFLVAAAREMFARLGPIDLPPYLSGPNRIDYYEAFKELHLPSSLEAHKRTLDSLAYYELVHMQLLIQEARENSLLYPGLEQLGGKNNLQQLAEEALPFKLTPGQKEAVEELNGKLADSKPSTTLLNAEVGSGKTIVSQLACLRSVDSGYQAVLIGPTDVLARQLYATLEKVVAPLNEAGHEVRIAFFGGSLKAAERKKLLAQIKEGEVDIIVGTHSVFGASVEYANLGLICIDEQQKFGAEQRSKLLLSRSDGKLPDLLMQSATPIPRSIAQTFYGDVDMFYLKDRPPGRLPIVTKWIQEDPLDVLNQLVNPMWSDLQEEAAKGNQTFIITPLVKESTTVDAASVERTFKEISEKILPDLKVGFVHGQMKNDEQKQTMEAFREKAYDVLVSSTVVEVGVDIPDATRVVIMSADRFGASSLHQIRGRIGRNSKPSVCYLVSAGVSENSQIRLQSLVDNDNGFEVAKVDLQVRGEGNIFGTDQSGASEMMFASLLRHSRWIERAKKEALDILSGPHREQALADSREKFSSKDKLV